MRISSRCVLTVSLWQLATLTTGFLLAGEELNRNAIVSRVRSDLEFLASDDQEGRGVETKGTERSADRIIAEYEKFGLLAVMPQNSYRQSFEVPLGGVVIEETTHVRLTSPDGTVSELRLGDEFQPIRRGANGEASGELVFLGYGIRSEEFQYDEFANVDVAGKVVVVIRREPQDYDGGAFLGKATSPNAYIDRKLELLTAANAAAVLFVNDDSSSPNYEADELATPSGFGNEGKSLPFVHVKQRIIDQVLSSTPLTTPDGKSLTSLKSVAKYLDAGLKPVSQALTGWTAEVTTRFKADAVTAHNLIGVIEGEGPHASQAIVIGGHYDHIGYGKYGSNARNREGEVHNGADDNASGTSAVLELARRFSSGPKPKHRMVFICFSGEERGLIGSNYYVKHPVVPLEDTITMINFDMIGNLRNNLVEVCGVGTAAEFREIARHADEVTPINIRIVDDALAGSDHLPFYQKDVPVMFCFTGMTSIYHTPDDDFETLNIEGVVSVIDYSEQLLRGIDRLEKAPVFISTRPRNRRAAARTPFFGIQPDLAASGADGILIQSVISSSPAALAGLQTGDIITQIDDSTVTGYQSLIDVLIGSSPGDTLNVRFKRGSEEKETQVSVAEPRR